MEGHLSHQNDHQALAKQDCAGEAAQLLRLDTDEFLPSLGGWSESLGQRALIGMLLSVVVLAIWPWRETVRAKGVIRPAGENTVVQSQLDGILKHVWIKEDEQVQKGQALAELDVDQLHNEERKLEQELSDSIAQQKNSLWQIADLGQQRNGMQALMQAQILSASRDINSAESTLKLRQSELQRYRRLISSGAIAMSIADEKEAQTALATNELAKARQLYLEQKARGSTELAKLSQAKHQAANQNGEINKILEETRARLSAVRRALNNSVIKAPTAGTVITSGMRHAQQVIQAGEVLAQIAPADAAQQVKVLVESRDVGNIRPAQQAYLRIAGCPYPDFGVLQTSVQSVSADSLAAEDPGRTNTSSAGSSLFEVSMKPVGRSLRAGKRQCMLKHGMDVEAEIITRDSTVLAHLLTKLRLLSGI